MKKVDDFRFEEGNPNAKATGEKKVEEKGRPNFMWYYPLTLKQTSLF